MSDYYDSNWELRVIDMAAHIRTERMVFAGRHATVRYFYHAHRLGSRVPLFAAVTSGGDNESDNCSCTSHQTLVYLCKVANVLAVSLQDIAELDDEQVCRLVVQLFRRYGSQYGVFFCFGAGSATVAARAIHQSPLLVSEIRAFVSVDSETPMMCDVGCRIAATPMMCDVGSRITSPPMVGDVGCRITSPPMVDDVGCRIASPPMVDDVGCRIAATPMVGDVGCRIAATQDAQVTSVCGYRQLASSPVEVFNARLLEMLRQELKDECLDWLWQYAQSDLLLCHEQLVLKNLAKWQDTPAHGAFVGPTRIIPMKLMRDRDSQHSPQRVLDDYPRVGLVVDLSNDEGSYDNAVFTAHGVQYRRLAIASKVVPSSREITEFVALLDGFCTRHPDRDVIVHCHYGFNRTGLMVCAYLIECLSVSVSEALRMFRQARPPGIRHQNYIDKLHLRYADAQV